MNSVSPVLTGTEVDAERVIALDQPEYYPVISLQINYGGPDGDKLSLATLTRFRFSDKEREAIAAGADLILSQPHHGPMMPIGIQLAFPNEYPIDKGDLE
jgi:hypothetical protein